MSKTGIYSLLLNNYQAPTPHSRQVKRNFFLFRHFGTLPLRPRFPFFPLLGETKKGSGNDPGNQVMISPKFTLFSPFLRGSQRGFLERGG